MEKINTNYVKYLFILAGLVLGAASFVLPFRLVVMLTAAAAFGIFAFYRLDIALCLFIFGMSIVPNELWNNLYIALAGVFFAGVYAIEWFMDRRSGIALANLAPSLVVYVLFCFLSLFTGFGGMDSVRVFAIFFGCVIFTVLLPNVIKDTRTLEMFVIAIFIAITISALFGLYQFRMGVEIRSEFTDLAQNQGLARLFSVMANPNNDAEYWYMFLPFCAAYLLTTKNDAKKIILAGMFAICLLSAVLTYSRTGYIAFVAGAGVFVLLVKPRLVPVFLLAFVCFIPFIPDSVVNRISTIGKDTSSTYRFYIWEGVFRVIKNYWAQGIGMGPSAFSTIYRVYAHPSAGPVMHSHNIILNTWVETGIGGAVALLAYFIRIGKDSLSAVCRPRSEKLKIYGAAGAASFTVLFVFGLAEYVWFYPRVMLGFWICMGLIHAICSINRSEA